MKVGLALVGTGLSKLVEWEGTEEAETARPSDDQKVVISAVDRIEWHGRSLGASRIGCFGRLVEMT
jgi:hypothetical protein